MKTKYHFDKKVQTATGVGNIKGNIVQEGESPANFHHQQLMTTEDGLA